MKFDGSFSDIDDGDDGEHYDEYEIVMFRVRRGTGSPLHHVHMRGQPHEKNGYRALGKSIHYLLPLVPDPCCAIRRMDKERSNLLRSCASHPAVYTSR